MSRIVRAALTETNNVYLPMPRTVDDLDSLTGHIDAIRNANLEHHGELIRRAHAQGAKIIGLGELFCGPYFALEKRPLWRGFAEDAYEGPSARFMSKLAAELGMVIVAPIYEREARTGHGYNTAVVIDADGHVLGLFRKAHIPEGTNEQGSFHETYYYGRADSSPYFPVFETAVGKLGVAICYDRHFEGVMRTLAAHGAEIVLSPAVTFGAKSERMWAIEFEVDASRHNLFIGGSNRKGVEPPFAIEYFGKSHFVGPGGRLPNISEHPNLVVSDLDLDELSRGDGSGWNLVRDGRPDIYGARKICQQKS